jgi:hypothetical protein
MDKKKVKELIQEVIRNNVDSLEFGNDKHNAPLRKANTLLHDALIELSKSDWISVEDRLPEYNERVLVRYKYGKETYTIISYRMKDERIRKYNNGFIHPIDGLPITHWKPIEKLEE